LSALETSVHDSSVAAFLLEATRRADELKINLQQVANRRLEVERRKEVGECC
jgi:hypothetical protein